MRDFEMEGMESISEILERARETLERETFDAESFRRIGREFLDELENFTGVLMRDIGRIIEQRYPVFARPTELASRYTFVGNPAIAPDSVTLTINIDNSGGTSPLTPTLRGLFAPAPFVDISPADKITVTLNGIQINPVYLSDIVLRQPARVEAVRYIKDSTMTLSEFHAISVRYELYGIWGNRMDLESYSLAQYSKEDNFKDTPLTIARGLVLDGNTGLSLLNFPAVPPGQTRTFTLVLYIGAYTSPGGHIGGEKPRMPIRIPGRPVRSVRPVRPVSPSPTSPSGPIRPGAGFDYIEEGE